jgi:4-hydroxy-tetrahydrodipicolinate synthase
MIDRDFSGCHVPLVTPFHDDLSVDEAGLRQLVDYYIETEKVDGLVPCGTTGESPSLTNEEHDRVIEIVVEQTAGRVPVIAGTGSNSTQEAIERTKRAEAAGADASLQVGPYYNRPSQEGIARHFEAIAAATNLPLILYNIPARTGRNIEPKTIIQLAKVDNVVGLKDAANDLAQTMEIIAGTSGDGKPFFVLAGEDAMTLALIAMGGHGAISAVANVIGREFTELCRLARAGDIEKARQIHYRMLPIVKALFIEPNPVPVKAALELMGLPAGPPRLPLLPLQPENRALLAELLRQIARLT